MQNLHFRVRQMPDGYIVSIFWFQKMNLNVPGILQDIVAALGKLKLGDNLSTLENPPGFLGSRGRE